MRDVALRGSRELVAAFRSFAESEQPTYLLNDEGRLTRTNRAWARFARENGGEAMLSAWPVGSDLLAAVPAALRAFYRNGFDTAVRTGERWEHDYECSSPDVFRKFRMLVYPYGLTLLVTHALLVERPHDREVSLSTGDYTHDDVITMCSHCRCVRHTGEQRWDWVPDLVAHMPLNISHGLCPACARYYYPSDADTP